jgi:putative addiction module killer protein
MVEIRSTAIFLKWLRGLRDARARARIQIRVDRLGLGNAGDVRSVGAGVSELWSGISRVFREPGQDHRRFVVRRRQADAER